MSDRVDDDYLSADSEPSESEYDAPTVRSIHWRAAVDAISKMEVGDVIPDAQFEEWLCAPRDSAQFRFQTIPMKDALIDRGIGLSRVRGIGYSISTPAQNDLQLNAGPERALRELRRAARYGAIVQVDKLTTNERMTHNMRAQHNGALLALFAQAARKLARMKDAEREEMKKIGTGKKQVEVDDDDESGE